MLVRSAALQSYPSPQYAGARPMLAATAKSLPVLRPE
jgi:hypothetical protein